MAIRWRVVWDASWLDGSFCGSTSKYLSLVRIQGPRASSSLSLWLASSPFPLIATLTVGLVARTVLTIYSIPTRFSRLLRQYSRLHASDTLLTINFERSKLDADNNDSSHPNFRTFVPIFLLLRLCRPSYHNPYPSSSSSEQPCCTGM